MVHLRIVVPPQLVAAILDRLVALATVINVVHLPGSAVKPPGDVFLCEVAREDASVVVEDLRALGVEEQGSIVVDPVATVLSKSAVAAERDAPGAPADAVVWEDVQARTSDEASASGSYFAFMVLAALITAVGLFLDSPILVVGGMVVGPEFGPMAGVCVAVVQRRRALAARSSVAIAVGFPVAIALTTLAALLFQAIGVVPDTFRPGDHLLSNSIAKPDFFALLVALCAGVAGMLSLSTAKSGALVGVAISVTTIPAAANAGVALSYGRTGELVGSLGQLAVNVAGILVAGTLTLAVQRWQYDRRRADHLRRGARRHE